MSASGMQGSLEAYVSDLARHVLAAEATGMGGSPLGGDAVEDVIVRAFATHEAGGRVWFVGNGGSAAIASHMANDYTKNGGIRASTVGDAAVLTCLANDYGYEQLYAKALEFQAAKGDGLVAISSSGNSPNIVNATAMALEMGLWVATLSGFQPTNRLRPMGHVNFYIRSENYGTVEVGHLMILHGILDVARGWAVDRPAVGAR